MKSNHLNEVLGQERTVEVLYDRFLGTEDNQDFHQIFQVIDALLIKATKDPLNSSSDVVNKRRQHTLYKRLEKIERPLVISKIVSAIRYEFLLDGDADIEHDYGRVFRNFAYRQDIHHGVMLQFFTFITCEKNQALIERKRINYAKEFKYLLVNEFQEWYFKFLKRRLTHHLGARSFYRNMKGLKMVHIEQNCSNAVPLDISFNEDFTSNLFTDELISKLKSYVSDRDVKLLVLKEVYGYSSKEVSSMLQMTVNAVNTASNRCKERLRTHLMDAA